MEVDFDHEVFKCISFAFILGLKEENQDVNENVFKHCLSDSVFHTTLY